MKYNGIQLHKDLRIKSGYYGYMGSRRELKINGSVYGLKFMLKAERKYAGEKYAGQKASI